MTDEAPWKFEGSPPQTGITPQLLDAVKHVESRGNVNAVSPAGARGPYQFMPATAAQYGLKDPHDEPSARDAAARYLTDLAKQFGGDVDKALLAYNWGPGNVRKGGPMPKEAQEYVGKVRTAEKNMSGQTDETPPWKFEGAAPATSPAPVSSPTSTRTGPLKETVGQTLKGMVDKRAGTGAEAGIALTASKMARAVGNLLPQAVSDWAEKHGYMPSEKDVEMLRGSIEDSLTGKAANIGTEVAATVIPGTAAYRAATSVPRVAAMRPVLQATVGGAAAGAAGNAMLDQPLAEGAGIGALLGPAGIGIGRAADYLVTSGLKTWHGSSGAATDYARRAFGDRTQAAINALRNVRQEVPGEMPTMRAAVSPELPEMAVFDEIARRGQQANLFTQRDAATNAARSQVLQDIEEGGQRLPNPVTGRLDPSVIEAARNAQTRPLYAAAMRQRLPIDDAMHELLIGPEVVPVVRRAMNRLDQAGRTAEARGARGPARTPEGTEGRMTVEELDAVLKELGNANMADYNIRTARAAVADLLESSPQYSQARALHRAMSMPQNQADVATTLRNALESPASDVTQRATVFANALRNAPGTFRRADLSPRFQTMEEVFQAAPERLEAIRGVERSLAREKSASDMLTNVGILPDKLTSFEQAAKNAPQLMNRWASIIRSMAKVLGHGRQQRMQDVIDRAAANPTEFANLLDQLPTRERSRVVNAVRNFFDTVDVPSYATGPAAAQVSGAFSQ